MFLTRLALQYLLVAGIYIGILLPWLENNINFSIKKTEDNIFFSKKAGKTELGNNVNPEMIEFSKNNFRSTFGLNIFSPRLL